MPTSPNVRLSIDRDHKLVWSAWRRCSLSCHDCLTDDARQKQLKVNPLHKWFPFPSKLHALLHYICNTDPTFTRRHAHSVIWLLKEAGVKNVPCYEEIAALRDGIPTPIVHRANCIDGRVGIFYFLPPSESIKFWAVHPDVYRHVTTLPRQEGGIVRDFMDTPRAREVFETLRIANIVHGGRFYFVDDFILWRDLANNSHFGRIDRLERARADAVSDLYIDHTNIVITIDRCIERDGQVFTIDEPNGEQLELSVNQLLQVCEGVRPVLMFLCCAFLTRQTLLNIWQ